MGLHLSIWYSQEPWLVTLGAAATAATVAVGTLLGLASDLLGPAYWVTLLAARRAARVPVVEGRLDAARVRQRELDLHDLEGDVRDGNGAAKAVARPDRSGSR